MVEVSPGSSITVVLLKQGVGRSLKLDSVTKGGQYRKQPPQKNF